MMMMINDDDVYLLHNFRRKATDGCVSVLCVCVCVCSCVHMHVCVVLVIFTPMDTQMHLHSNHI